MWYCFAVISWRINKVCRNRLLVEWYLSLNMNLTALFISTSTSWHVTLTNKNITSTKIILGNEPIGIITKLLYTTLFLHKGKWHGTKAWQFLIVIHFFLRDAAGKVLLIPCNTEVIFHYYLNFFRRINENVIFNH